MVRLATKELPLNATTRRVIDSLDDLYNRRASKSHGKFSDNHDNYPTSKHLREYILAGEKGFGDLTTKMMATLQQQASHKGAATGGHVLFAHFERGGRQFLLVAIVTDRLGAALTENYDFEDVEHLDMDGFRFAGRINIDGWTAGEERYIGFLKGKGAVSEYFKEFLGCDTTIQDRQDTTDLVSALKSFAESQGMTGAGKDEFLARAKTICERSSKAGEHLEFEPFANELMPKSPQTLLDALAHPDLKLNDGFVPDRRALSPLVKFKARTALWSIEFERDALREGKVRFDAVENTLTLTELPPELAGQLKHEITAGG